MGVEFNWSRFEKDRKETVDEKSAEKPIEVIKEDLLVSFVYKSEWSLLKCKCGPPSGPIEISLKPPTIHPIQPETVNENTGNGCTHMYKKNFWEGNQIALLNQKKPRKTIQIQGLQRASIIHYLLNYWYLVFLVWHSTTTIHTNILFVQTVDILSHSISSVSDI